MKRLVSTIDDRPQGLLEIIPEAIVTLAESEWSEARSARGTNETQILQTQCSNIC